MSEPPRRKVTYRQLEALWEILIHNRNVALGYNKTAQAREFSRRMWEQVALSLNSHGDGAIKDWRGWCKYWNDYKCKLKKITASLRAGHTGTGGGPACGKSLSEIERKFLVILGDDYGSGMPGVRIEPFVNIQETERTNSAEANSDSILISIPLLDDAQPGPSWRVTPPPLLPSTSSNQLPNLIQPQLPSTPRRSPRRRRVDPQSPLPTPQIRASVTPRHSPRRSPRTATPALLPLASAASGRRVRARRELPMSAEQARRALIAESRRQTQIEQEKLDIWKAVLVEIKEFKNIFQSRFIWNPDAP